MDKIVAIIQARMGSTRLPGKVMKDLCGKSVLSHVIERVKQSQLVNEIVIATTEHEKDDIIVKEAQKCGAYYFRGKEDDVLSRYYYAAKEKCADVIVRITSDCPLIDPVIIDKIINEFLQQEKYNLVTNAGSHLENRTFPRGLDTEVFSFAVLQEAFRKAGEGYQREHVTPYIYENFNKIFYYKNEIDYSSYRWTLDTAEDLELIKKIYNYLYHGKHDFYMEDIISLMEKYPQLKEINSQIKQKKIK